MQERKWQLSMLTLMVMLVGANTLIGGPSLPPLPSVLMEHLTGICMGGAIFLFLFLLVDARLTREREEREAMRKNWQETKRIVQAMERESEIRTNPNARPETYAEQIKKKKGLR